MGIEIREQAGDVKVYGSGSLGGKGDGLVRINAEVLPKASRLKTWILSSAVEAAKAYGTPGNYVNGANIGGFLKVANAMMEQGVV